MKNKKAFTLAELMMVIAIGAAIATLTIGVFKGAGEYLNKVKLNNITIEFKNGINAVISNPYYYTDDGDLGNTKEVRIEDAFDATEKIYKEKNKFRGLLLYELKVLESNPVPCYAMTDNKSVSSGNCYKGTNNVLWSIPDTDFNQVGIVFASNASGAVYKYVPITVYPPSTSYSNLTDFNKYAIIYGIRRDGDLTAITNVDCSDSENTDYNQCKIYKTISSKVNKENE